MYETNAFDVMYFKNRQYSSGVMFVEHGAYSYLQKKFYSYLYKWLIFSKDCKTLVKVLQ